MLCLHFSELHLCPLVKLYNVLYSYLHTAGTLDLFLLTDFYDCVLKDLFFPNKICNWLLLWMENHWRWSWFWPHFWMFLFILIPFQLIVSVFRGRQRQHLLLLIFSFLLLWLKSPVCSLLTFLGTLNCLPLKVIFPLAPHMELKKYSLFSFG